MGESVKAKSVVPTWDEIRGKLEDRRRRISEEISAYPTPIAACDAHINHLIAERERVSEELNRLEEAARSNAASARPEAAIEAFLRSSSLV